MTEGIASLDVDEILHRLKLGVTRTGFDVRGHLFDVLERPPRMRGVVALTAVGGGGGRVVGAVLAVEAEVVVVGQ